MTAGWMYGIDIVPPETRICKRTPIRAAYLGRKRETESDCRLCECLRYCTLRNRSSPLFVGVSLGNHPGIAAEAVVVPGP